MNEKGNAPRIVAKREPDKSKHDRQRHQPATGEPINRYSYTVSKHRISAAPKIGLIVDNLDDRLGQYREDG